MPADVSGTISGSGGGISTVGININSSGNAVLAQDALNSISGLITTPGALSVYSPTTAGGATATAPAGNDSSSGVLVTVPGYTGYASLPGNNTVLLVTGSGNTVAATGSTNSTTVVAGSGSTVVFLNNDTTSVPSYIYLGGGNNYVGENSSTASAVINVDGSTVSALGSSTGLGGSYIDGHQGSTTVNLYSNAIVYLNTGSVAASQGQNVIVAQPGTAEVLGISGSSTVPVTVTGSAGSTLYITNDATAFINPGAGNIVLSAGTTSLGEATLFGGTGSDTVLGTNATGKSEDGYFQGGSGGNNIIVSSTVAGATTIVGAGSGNLLWSNANNDSINAGTGTNDTIVAYGVTGDTLIGGAGTDTIYGSSAGDTFIGFGSGSAVATGWHGAANNVGNTYFQAVSGGVDTITDFLPGTDVFSLTLTSAYEHKTVTVASYGTLTAGSQVVTLSDGSSIHFTNLTTAVSSSNFT